MTWDEFITFITTPMPKGKSMTPSQVKIWQLQQAAGLSDDELAEMIANYKK